MVASGTDPVRRLWRTVLASALLLPIVCGSALGQGPAAPKAGPARKQAAWAALNDEAMSLYREGKLVEAEPVLKRALAVAEKELGPNNPNVGRVLYELASLYFEQGKYPEAEPLYQRSLKVAEKALRPDSPTVAFILDGLGRLYTAQGKYGQAETSFKRALTITDKALAPDDPKVARILTGYSELLRKTQRVEAAEQMDARARKIRGPDADDSPTAASHDGGLAPDRLAEARAANDKGDYETAARLFRELAAEGNAFAQSVLGDWYMLGEGVPKDPVEGVGWYRKAADQGLAVAQINLGASYENGLGVSKDAAEAVRWYRKAAEQGDPRAQRYVGDMYAKGIGVPRDRKEAERWYGKAAAQGEARAEDLMRVPDSLREGTPKSMLSLGMRAVEVQDSIGLVRWVAGHPSTLMLGKEKVTSENAREVLDRLEGERKSLDAAMELMGSSPVAGNYSLGDPAKNKCKAFGDRPLDYPVRISVVQAKNAVELRGKGIAGCGVVVGNLVVMKDQECGGTTPGRLLAVAADSAIKDLTLYENVYDNAGNPGCLLGTLTRVEAPK